MVRHLDAHSKKMANDLKDAATPLVELDIPTEIQLLETNATGQSQAILDVTTKVGNLAQTIEVNRRSVQGNIDRLNGRVSVMAAGNVGRFQMGEQSGSK